MRKPKNAIGRFKRALKKGAANLKSRINLAKDYYAGLIDVVTGKAESNEKRNFLRAYRKEGEKLQLQTARINDYAQKADKKQNRVTRFSRQHLGKMFIYKYYPKHVKTLPYYDAVPLILLMEVRPKGFLGLNLHYLQPYLRAMLLDAIVDNNIKNKRFSDDAIVFNYRIMKSAAKSNLYKPCVKEYLFPFVRSSFFLEIPGKDWEQVLFLPFERFKKQQTIISKQYVWKQSRKLII